MGVHGLTTYVERVSTAKNYAETIVVRGGPVVIDGSNLMYHLYFAGRSPVVGKPLQGCSIPNKAHLAYLYGGDWMLYAQNVRYFFQQLKHCEIIPIVIFDGAYESDKLKVSLKRFAHTVSDNVNQTDGGKPGSTYAPLLLKTVFLEILSEQNIPHYQTSFEADQTIAYLAKLLGRCPILSEDSDFYIYADAVSLPLKSLKFRLKQQGKEKKSKKARVKASGEGDPEVDPSKKVWTLEGTHIPIMKIMKKEFNIESHEVLAIGALLIGNDNLYTGNFFITRQGVPLSQSIDSAFKSLAKMRKVEHILERILDSVPVQQKPIVAKQLMQNLSAYKGNVGDSTLWTLIKKENNLSQWIDESIENSHLMKDKTTEFLQKFLIFVETTTEKEEKSDINCDVDVITADSKGRNKNVPEWFLGKHHKCEFQTYLRNIRENQIIFLVPQVEIRSKSPCHHLSLPIIRVTSGILLGNSKKFLTTATHASGKAIQIEVAPMIDLHGFGTVPFLSEYFEANGKGDLGSIAHEIRLKLILSTLGIREKGDTLFYEGWPQAYKIWIATLLFFIKQTENEVGTLEGTEKDKINFVRRSVIAAVFMCVIKSLLTNPGAPTVAHERNPTLRTINEINQLTIKDPKYLASIRGFYEKFEDVSKANVSDLAKMYDIDCARCVCQYMCIMHHADMLNSLLFNPLKHPKFRYTINNYFIYNFACYLNNPPAAVRDTNNLTRQTIRDEIGLPEVNNLLDNLHNVMYRIDDYVNLQV